MWFINALVDDIYQFSIVSVHTFNKAKNNKSILIVFWLIMHGWQIEKGLDIRRGAPNHSNYFQKYCPWLYLLVGWVSWPNDIRFKRYIQNCNRPCVLIIIMMSQVSKFVEWFEVEKKWIFQEWRMTFTWNEMIRNFYIKDYIFTSYHFQQKFQPRRTSRKFLLLM